MRIWKKLNFIRYTYNFNYNHFAIPEYLTSEY